MKIRLHKYATFCRFIYAVCMVLCAVFTSPVALAANEPCSVLEREGLSFTVAPTPTPNQLYASDPFLVPEVAYRNVFFSLPKTQSKSGFERHSSAKALHRAPQFPRVPAVSAEVFFFWRNQRHGSPSSSGMRALVHYTLPPPHSI